MRGRSAARRSLPEIRDEIRRRDTCGEQICSGLGERAGPGCGCAAGAGLRLREARISHTLAAVRFRAHLVPPELSPAPGSEHRELLGTESDQHEGVGGKKQDFDVQE